MAEHEHAWAAGLFDGEGWLYIKARDNTPDRVSRRFTLNVGITNSETELLDPFLKWGGRIRPVKGTALTRKQCYAWTIEARAAALFLMDVLPFLRGKKRKKAEIAIEFQARLRPTLRRRESNGTIGLTKAEEIAWRQKAREMVSA